MPKKQQKVVKKKRISKELVRSNNVVVTKPTSKSWKPVVGFEGLYEVSVTGSVRSLDRDSVHRTGKTHVLKGKVIRPSKDKDGYLLVHLYKEGEVTTLKVHRVVAEAFLPNPNGYKEINHLNEIKDDNRPENLEWCTRKRNMTYGTRSDKASESLTKYAYQRFTLSGEYVDTLTNKELEKHGFSAGTIWRCSVGKCRKSSGFLWNRIPVEDIDKFPSPIMRKNGVVVNRTMSKTTWKSFENLVAKFFGTRRVPLSGSNSGHGTNSDSLHPKLYIECKVRGKIALWQLFTDTEKKAKVESKVPVVAVKQKGEKGYLLLIRPEDLQKIAEIQKEILGVTK